MELTATNRSQAYPNAEKADTDRQEQDEARKWFGLWMAVRIHLRSKGTDENVKHFWKYPLYDSFRSKVGLKKFKKDLQLSDECSMILYVVLKARDVLINKICFHDIPR